MSILCSSVRQVKETYDPQPVHSAIRTPVKDIPGIQVRLEVQDQHAQPSRAAGDFRSRPGASRFVAFAAAGGADELTTI